MGRPLNKKYFGNRNVGTGGYQLGQADDFIGGEGIASINWSNLGSWRSGAVTGLALPAPSEPGGVQATWNIFYSIVNDATGVTTGAGKSGLVVGWKGTNTSLPGYEVTVTDVSGSNALFAITTVGTPFATIPFSGNGQGVTWTKSGGGGTAANFLTDVNWQVDGSTAIVEKGSGYIGTETFTVTTANGTPPAGTIVLTTDSGSRPGYGDLNANTNQENAILIYAKTTTGGSSKLGDIIKQTNARSYKVKTADGTSVVKLVAAAPAKGQATITATDSSGKTYYVIKLTAHKALLVPYGANGHEFPTTGTEADGSPIYQSVKWTFSAATAGATVTVANA